MMIISLLYTIDHIPPQLGEHKRLGGLERDARVPSADRSGFVGIRGTWGKISSVAAAVGWRGDVWFVIGAFIGAV